MPSTRKTLLTVLPLLIFALSGCDSPRTHPSAKPMTSEDMQQPEQSKREEEGRGQPEEQPPESAQADRKEQTAPEVTPTYNIVSLGDSSYLGVKRYDVRVRVGHVLSRDELETLSQAIVEQLKKTNPHNALMLFYYLPDSDTDGGYTAGKAVWAPYGDYSRADEAYTGTYSKHVLKVFPGNATGLDVEKVQVRGLSTETKKRIFFELVAAQDRGVGDNEAYRVIANRFNIDEATVRKIAIEGVAKGWPMPNL